MALEKLCKIFRFARTAAKNVRGSTIPINSAELSKAENAISKAADSSCGLKLPAIETDVCQFKTDMSLTPDFLKSLLRTEGKTNTEKIINMKDKMLRAMGYKNPELLDIKINNSMDYFMGFEPESGKLILNEAFIDSPLMCSDLSEAIALLRHEFDHLDKFVKTYKYAGADKFLSSLKQRANTLGIKNQKVNLDFYKQMSKEVDITNFEGKTWLEAISDVKASNVKENTNYFDEFLNEYFYAGQKLEESAYGIQSKVQETFGKSPLTFYDVHYNDFDKVLKALENVPEKTRGQTFHDLYQASYIMQQTGDISLVKALTQKPETLTSKILDKFKSIELHLPTLQEKREVLLTVQNWLNSGKYTIEDILPTLI